jgi:hypothetical protein
MSDPLMLLDANDCELIIKWHKRYLYRLSFEYALMTAQFSKDVITDFYYHPTLYDNEGEPIGKSEDIVKASLKVVKWNTSPIPLT